MSRIAFLIAETETLVDGNYLRLGRELVRRGHQVNLLMMESLTLSNSSVSAVGFTLTASHHAASPWTKGTLMPLDDFDLVWVMSLGMRHSFLDKLQLLFTTRAHCRIINSIDAIMHFKSKYFMASHPDVWQHPATWASNRPDFLFGVMKEEGGKWVVKPPAASFGHNVYLLTPADPNAHVILESMCGPDEDQYCLLQRYVPEIITGEKRVLFAGGKPVGQYLRTATRDHRTNAQLGAKLTPCELSPDEQSYCERIGRRLMDYGAVFVGMDLVYPWVIEFNVINPGGLLTIAELTGEDLSGIIVDQILST